jgi:hypothetical protein
MCDEKIPIIGGCFNSEFSQKILTSPVKTEYPTEQRFDIAFINEKKIMNYDIKMAKKYKWKSNTFWSQRLKAAIEIKYLQEGMRLSQFYEQTKKDVIKLNEYQSKFENDFFGFSIIFIQMKDIKLDLIKISKEITYKEIHDYPNNTGLYMYIIYPDNVTKYSIFIESSL